VTGAEEADLAVVALINVDPEVGQMVLIRRQHVDQILTRKIH
jgi:hypothetical protein